MSSHSPRCWSKGTMNEHFHSSSFKFLFLLPAQDNCFLHANVTVRHYYTNGIYLLKVNNKNTRTRCQICSKLTIKAPEHDVDLVSLLLTLNVFYTMF